MTTSTAKPYYASQEVHDAFTKLGNGNRSKGAQVAAVYHWRLVEALDKLHRDSLSDFGYRGSPRCNEVDALLAEIEGAGK